MGKINIDKAGLECLYFDEGKTFKEIALIYDCHAQTICNRFKEFGLSARSAWYHFKGKPQSEEHKAKKAAALRGRKFPGRQGRKKGFISWNKGLRKAVDPKMCNTGNLREKHWNWKGGVSDVNVRIRQSSRYKVWRERVFGRDHYTCRTCGKHGGYLNAHHIKSFISFPKHRFDIENGLTLCRPCHTNLHRGDIKWQ